jgi:transposase
MPSSATTSVAGTREERLAAAGYIVFVDEAGFMLEPIIRRTWAPKGKTPILKINRPHDRISVIGAISIRRKDRLFAFHYRLSPDNTNFRGPTVVRFIDDLSNTLKGQMTVIWDEISIHWGAAMKDYLAEHPYVEAEAFPPYAPELNPVDMAWSHVKYGRLANYCPHDLTELRATLDKEFTRLKQRPDLLESFLAHTGLSLDD